MSYIEAFNEWLQKEGAAPRPGLVFDRNKHRWVRPEEQTTSKPKSWDWETDEEYRPHALRWKEQAKNKGDKLYSEYIDYVVEHGHLTPTASSVLREFVEGKPGAKEKYRHLADLMEFKTFKD